MNERPITASSDASKTFHHVHKTFTITAVALKERLDHGWSNEKKRPTKKE